MSKKLLPFHPYHNASLESWHGHLKREWVYQFKYKNFEEAYQSIFWYIEAFYNSKRIHQSLGYLTPNQFEKGFCCKVLNLLSDKVE